MMKKNRFAPTPKELKPIAENLLKVWKEALSPTPFDR